MYMARALGDLATQGNSMNSAFTKNVVAALNHDGLSFNFVGEAVALKAVSEALVSAPTVNADSAVNVPAAVADADNHGVATQFVDAFNELKDLSVVITEGLIVFQSGVHVMGFLSLDSTKSGYAIKYMSKQRAGLV
jgi:hypothetical protein